MKKTTVFLLLLLSIFFSNSSLAQDYLDPVKWKVTVEKEKDNRYNILMTATIDEGWHTYSQKQFGEEFEGPIPTEFSYNDSETTFKLLGPTSEPDITPVYDPVFELDVVYFSDKVTFIQPIEVINSEGLKITAEVYYSVCDEEKCLPPETKTFELDLASGTSGVSSEEITSEDLDITVALTLDLKGMDRFEPAEKEEKGLWTIFLLGFLGGLIALLTPCVFPMIPLTVSFFTKSAKNKQNGIANAVMYGAFIFLIYVLLSLPFHLLDSLDPEILNSISTNVTLNVIFFTIFMVFAFSFFGYYEITLPQSWSAKMDSKATSIGGMVGIFFMALTLAIVSFSCTGPILGSLLGGSLSSDGGAMQLTFGMGGFGLALALPFALFALFPNWLNSLPRSGGWLNTVKVVLGFIEVALAFKFLSNADLVEHWGLLKREIFIAIWIVCALGLALYLFGFIRFPHDGPKTKRIPKGNLLVGIMSIAFLLYLTPGLTNTKYANLKLLSGFPPPLFYSLYDKGLEMESIRDFDEALELAKASGKPIMIDFTGWACVNCRKMEEQVWTIPEINKIISEKYVLVSLYVDDREELPEDQKFNFLKPTGGVKKIKTVGDKWATFQTVNFKNNSQPYYILLDTELNLLNKPVGYTPDTEVYRVWLETGLENFNVESKGPN
ncbi:MAG TPA: cytochrome c biogenesis protein CcdA [Flavobacteriaceae bacterium]|nr:thioredoxin family protein [Flavobacteriaceae bacterium]MCB9213553.1 thioredoxin family protein [Alteromonas sp.]HPF10779.1 cytochrome c biogenesis protein CcdA [Flavobacteriaceae bacterium]HQU21012.1 cytochrome c biogenesis protein CcdA [Flavobacteriaceae bacterium]HQU65482.1 cytochrome c biogenesis protein CcdA [Flavobacteriaceae bacterium]